MDIAKLAQTRHTCKAYDPSRQISAEVIQQIKTLLRFSPSSVNSQPWHFYFATHLEARTRLAQATPEGSPYAANRGKILAAPCVIVICTRQTVDDAYLDSLLAQEANDGRFPSPEGQEMQRKGRAFFVGLNRRNESDLLRWTQKQAYLALGTLLLGAASLGLDATPIEGFDPELLDQALALPEKGLRSAVMVALGYRSNEDFNATLPKSRWPEAQVITDL